MNNQLSQQSQDPFCYFEINDTKYLIMENKIFTKHSKEIDELKEITTSSFVDILKSNNLLYKLFPDLIVVGKCVYMGNDKKISFRFKIDINDEELVEKIGIPYVQVCMLKNKIGLDLDKIIPEELLDKYCLLFRNKVFFHSSDYNEILKYEKEHNLCFTRYIPVLDK